MVMWCAALFAIWYTAWHITGTGLNSLVANGSGWLQVTMLSTMGAMLIVGYTWADHEMGFGGARFSLPDGSPCQECGHPLASNLTTNPMARQLGMGRGPWFDHADFTNRGTGLLRWAMFLFVPIGFLQANDIRMMKRLSRLLELPQNKRYHFFICHHQASGGNQAKILFDQLTELGCEVWLDNDQGANCTLDGMKQGIRESATLLILLSGRKELQGVADINGQYEGVFTRHFCHEEIHTALEERLHIIGVQEEDMRFGKPDFGLEKSRAMTGGAYNEFWFFRLSDRDDFLNAINGSSRNRTGRWAGERTRGGEH